MSSTRHAAPGSVLNQERYLSDPEFERGLKALPVARRCELLTDRKERELTWWLQAKSNQEGGLEALAAKLIECNPTAFATPSMRAYGTKANKEYTADMVKQVRSEIRKGLASLGDVQALQSWKYSGGPFMLRGEFPAGKLSRHEADFELADTHPESYQAGDFVMYCQDAAEVGLRDYILNACLSPSITFSDKSPWYFSGLRSALLNEMQADREALSAKVVVTQIGRKVHRCVDKAHKTRSLVLVNGVARIGKSFSARTWCEQNSGIARFVEVPPTNDDVGFYRAIARGLGLGSFLRYKAQEVRERVEAVLMTGQLLLVLDEAHRLWPQMNYRYGFPNRVNWVMSMINHGVPICALVTPQFFTQMQGVVSRTGWASEQLTGRITHHEELPSELSKSDLEAVARNLLPEAGDVDISALVAYARSSAKYLAAIDAVARSARYLAEEAGRDHVCRADIQEAMREGVIPSDHSLAKALATTAPKRARKNLPLPTVPTLNEAEEAEGPAPNRLAGVEIAGSRQPRCTRPAVDLAGA